MAEGGARGRLARGVLVVTGALLILGGGLCTVGVSTSAASGTWYGGIVLALFGMWALVAATVAAVVGALLARYAGLPPRVIGFALGAVALALLPWGLGIAFDAFDRVMWVAAWAWLAAAVLGALVVKDALAARSPRD